MPDRRGVLALAALAGLAAVALRPAGADPMRVVPAVTVAASAHRAISTHSTQAQTEFDRGLALLYAFDIGEARARFVHAEELDRRCALAYAYAALSEVTDINVDPAPADVARGRAAIAAAGHAREATPAERELIAAIATRFTVTGTEASRQHAYEAALRAYAGRYPADDDAAVQTAFAIWHAESSLDTPVAGEIETDLDRALAHDPQQLGANHLRVHYEEETGKPARALANADMLANMSYEPGMSHLPHMAGHIYNRLGDYAGAIRVNEIALANDRAYFAEPPGPGQSYMHNYHDHDLDFVLYGLTTLGRGDEAKRVAAGEDAYARAGVALRERDWKAVLADPGAPRSATGLAHAFLGQTDLALSFTRLADGKPASPLLVASIRAAIARVRGDEAEALKQYAIAYANATEPGDPKRFWYAPAGEAYAAELLRAKRYADADKVFSEELVRYPNDPRLAFGRALARRQLGHASAADADDATVTKYWDGARPLSVDDLG